MRASSSPTGCVATCHLTSRPRGRKILVGMADDPDPDQIRKDFDDAGRIVQIKRTKKDAEHSRWRSSFMNWGHDPLK